MAPDLTTTDGEVLAEDLSPAEMAKLRQHGVLPTDDGDSDGDGGDTAGDGGDGDAPDDPTDAPDTSGDATAGDGDGDDTPEADPGDDDIPDDAPESDGDDAGGGGDGDAGTDDAPDMDADDADGGDGPGDAPEMDAGDMTNGDGPDMGDLSDELDDLGDDGWDDPDDAGDTTDGDSDGGEAPDDGGDGGSSDLGGEQGSDGDNPDDAADSDPGTDGDDGGDADGDPTGDADGEPAGDDGGGGDPADNEQGGTGKGGTSGEGGGEVDEDAIREMQDRAKDREVEMPDADPSVNEDMWEDRLEQARDTAGLRQAIKDRDTNVADPAINPIVDGQATRDTMHATGLHDDFRREFEKIKDAPTPRNARSGSDLDMKTATRLMGGDPTAKKPYLRQDGSKERATRAIGVCLDASGSMTLPGDKPEGQVDRLNYDPTDYDGVTRIGMARVALAGLAMACDIIGDDFTATAFQEGDMVTDEGRRTVDTPLITAPGEPFKWEHLDSVYADGGTPMAAGIRKSATRLMESDMPDKTLIVIADGEPSDPDYFEGETHHWNRQENVRAIVEQVRSAGIGVVGIGIGDVEPDSMATMFGTDKAGNPRFVMANGQDLPAKLREVYEKELDTV